MLENQRTLRSSSGPPSRRFGKIWSFDECFSFLLSMIIEVTGLELDTLVHTAWAQEGVLGARMTGGAGFMDVPFALVQKMLLMTLKSCRQNTTREVVGYAPVSISLRLRWHSCPWLVKGGFMVTLVDKFARHIVISESSFWGNGSIYLINRVLTVEWETRRFGSWDDLDSWLTSRTSWLGKQFD